MWTQIHERRESCQQSERRANTVVHVTLTWLTGSAYDPALTPPESEPKIEKEAPIGWPARSKGH
jgi:hypothetical protein